MTKNQFLLSIVVAFITLSYVVVHFYTEPVSRVIVEDTMKVTPDHGQLPKGIFKKIEYKHGKMLCTTVNPGTQCEVGVDCETGKPIKSISIAEFLKIETDPKISIEGQACATFDIDIGSVNPKNPCRFSGGRVYCY